MRKPGLCIYKISEIYKLHDISDKKLLKGHVASYNRSYPGQDKQDK